MRQSRRRGFCGNPSFRFVVEGSAAFRTARTLENLPARRSPPVAAAYMPGFTATVEMAGAI